MKKRILICLLILVGAAFLFYLGIQKTHTFTLADREGSSLKGEQIQLVFGTVRVSSSCDTAVVFTDTETGETYEIGYLTPGIREKIRLRRGRWYTGNRCRRAYHGGGHSQDRISGADVPLP